MANTAKTELDSIINEMAEALRPLVAKIEARTPTTQGHYGTYMGLIAQGQSAAERLGLAVALKRAGADKGGVDAAVRILGLI